MSDERLRELERRWKETGSIEDEAVYLVERVRVGDLTQEMLDLAARLGSGAAQCSSLQEALPFDPWESDPFESWFDSLHGINPEAARIAPIMGITFVLPQVDHVNKERYQRIVSVLIQYCYDWTQVGCGEWEWSDSSPSNVAPESRALAYAVRTGLRCLSEEDLIYNGMNSLGMVSMALAKQRGMTGVEENIQVRTEIKQAVCSRLANWALGYLDTARELTEEKQE